MQGAVRTAGAASPQIRSTSRSALEVAPGSRARAASTLRTLRAGRSTGSPARWMRVAPSTATSMAASVGAGVTSRAAQARPKCGSTTSPQTAGMTNTCAARSISDRILVIGADGTVARATLDALVLRGNRVRALVRRPRTEPDTSLPIEWFVGDIGEPGTLRRALDGVRTVLYVSPHAEEEVALAEQVVAECRRAGARLVFVGVHVSGVTWRGRLTRLLFRLLLPAYGPKLTIGAMVETTSPEVVMLVPSNFYDNDLTFLPDILTGSFPTPLRGVNRVAAADIGEVAAMALTDPSFPAGSHGISGPASLSGAESAAVWAEALGRSVRYTGGDTDAWEAALIRRIPAGKKRDDWRNSFRALGWMRMGTSAREVEETALMLGRPPTTYRGWVRSHVDALGVDQQALSRRAGTMADADLPRL